MRQEPSLPAKWRHLTWYHGDTSDGRQNFADQRWDRECNQSSLNEAGPGIYFTTKRSTAEGYGSHLYLARIKPSFRAVPQRKPSLDMLQRFYRWAPPEDKVRFITDWAGIRTPEILKKYAQQYSYYDTLLSLYGDLYRDPAAWVRAMKRLGFSGALIPKERETHLVVWSPDDLIIQQEY
jgi:hypothetical protein